MNERNDQLFVESARHHRAAKVMDKVTSWQLIYA